MQKTCVHVFMSRFCTDFKLNMTECRPLLCVFPMHERWNSRHVSDCGAQRTRRAQALRRFRLWRTENSPSTSLATFQIVARRELAKHEPCDVSDCGAQRTRQARALRRFGLWRTENSPSTSLATFRIVAHRELAGVSRSSSRSGPGMFAIWYQP